MNTRPSSIYLVPSTFMATLITNGVTTSILRSSLPTHHHNPCSAQFMPSSVFPYTTPRSTDAGTIVDATCYAFANATRLLSRCQLLTWNQPALSVSPFHIHHTSPLCIMTCSILISTNNEIITQTRKCTWDLSVTHRHCSTLYR